MSNYRSIIQVCTLVVCFTLLNGCDKDENAWVLEEYFLSTTEVDPSCFDHDLNDYRSYGLIEQCLVDKYVEDFKNSSTWFEGEESDCTFGISGGVYASSCQGSVTLFTDCKPCKNIPLENYQIELEVKIISDGYPCSLNWGGYEVFENVYSFGINKKMEYTVRNVENKEFIDPLVPLTFSALINNSEFNKLTIRKVNNRIFLFINEILVEEFIDLLLYGSDISLSVGAGAKVEFDNFRYSEIER